jgi:hypothetical protein
MSCGAIGTKPQSVVTCGKTADYAFGSNPPLRYGLTSQAQSRIHLLSRMLAPATSVAPNASQHVPNLVQPAARDLIVQVGQPDRSARRKDDLTIRRWKGAIPAI